MALAKLPVRFPLPGPWQQPAEFSLDDLPQVTWLVGPNGSGKSRFLRAMSDSIRGSGARFVGADRLNDARTGAGSQRIWGRNSAHFSGGINKSFFDNLVNVHEYDADLASTITLLYQRPDLRIRVEATLSQLLARDIRLEMIDGTLQPRMTFRSTANYDLFADECHGVLELIVLLANIYDNTAAVLMIDEPEQNLHPQHQAFVLEEIKRANGRRFVLASHSPFFLAIKTLDDLRGVLCFHSDFRPPSRYSAQAHIDFAVSQALPRMAEQHRAFFFAEKPVFVEGYFDATMIGSIQEGLGFSAASAGSSVVPAIGKDDAIRYLMLCNALEKSAAFVFDLDGLFEHRLSSGAEQMTELVKKISDAGHVTFDKLRGQLETALTAALNKFQTIPDTALPAEIKGLREYLTAESASVKQRVAFLVALAHDEELLRRCGMPNEVGAVLGLRNALLKHLATVGIHVLPGGALENYLPSYKGSLYRIPDDAKAKATTEEIAWLATRPLPAEIRTRYGSLGEIVAALPGKPQVDIIPVLQQELADVLHGIIVAIRQQKLTAASQIPGVLGERWAHVSNFVSVRDLEVSGPDNFRGELTISDKFEIGERICRFDNTTQTNNPATLMLE
jgi:predicted ATPase